MMDEISLDGVKTGGDLEKIKEQTLKQVEEERRKAMETEARNRINNELAARRNYEPKKPPEEINLTKVILSHIPYYLLYAAAAFLIIFIGSGYRRPARRLIDPKFALAAAVIVTVIAIIKDIRQYRKAEAERRERGLK